MKDLEIIFSKFGKVKAEIIRDTVTGDSLNYAFVEFDNVRRRGQRSSGKGGPVTGSRDVTEPLEIRRWSLVRRPTRRWIMS